MDWLTAAVAAIYIILYPAIYLAQCAMFLLQLALTPFVDLGLGVLHMAFLPLRILLKFEALFEFLFMALLTGVTAGLILHYINALLVGLLHLSSPPEPETLPDPIRKGMSIVPRSQQRRQRQRQSERSPGLKESIMFLDDRRVPSADYITGYGKSVDRDTRLVASSPGIMEEEEEEKGYFDG